MTDQGDAQIRREPRWGLLAALGGAGLALYLGLSLWAFMRHVGPSLRVEHASHWRPGTQTPLRVELRDEDGHSAAISDQGVALRLTAPGRAPRELGVLPVYEMRKGKGTTRAQAMVAVPRDWPVGPSRLELRLALEDGQPLERSCGVEVLDAPIPRRSGQAIQAAAFVQDADPSDEQPKGYRFEIRAQDVPRASLPGTLWLSLTTDKGAPLLGHVQVELESGEFKPSQGVLEGKRLLDHEIPKTGLLRLDGTLTSEQLGVTVKVWAKAPRPGQAPKAKRKIVIRAFPGSSSLRARWREGINGLELETRYASLVATRRASVDVFDQDGRWVALLDPPLWPQDAWVPHALAGLPQGFLQLEAYAGVRKVQPSIPGSVLWHGSGAVASEEELRALIRVTRARLARWPKEEREGVGGFLDRLAKGPWSSEEREQIVRWLTQTLPAARFAAPLVNDTRKQAKEELEAFRERWRFRLRALLWGGFAIYALLVALVYARHQRAKAAQLAEELVPVMKPGAGLWLRVGGVLAVATVCVWLLGMLMENLV